MPRFILRPSHSEFAAAVGLYFFSTTWYSHRLGNERFRELLLAVMSLLGVSVGIALGLDIQSIMLFVISWTIVIALLTSTSIHKTLLSARKYDLGDGGA